MTLEVSPVLSWFFASAGLAPCRRCVVVFWRAPRLLPPYLFRVALLCPSSPFLLAWRVRCCCARWSPQGLVLCVVPGQCRQCSWEVPWNGGFQVALFEKTDSPRSPHRDVVHPWSSFHGQWYLVRHQCGHKLLQVALGVAPCCRWCFTGGVGSALLGEGRGCRFAPGSAAAARPAGAGVCLCMSGVGGGLGGLASA